MMLEELKNARKVVGLNQTVRAVEEQAAKKVYIAKDSDPRVIMPLYVLCQQYEVEVEQVESMKVLGKACGIEVKAAVACILSE